MVKPAQFSKIAMAALVGSVVLFSVVMHSNGKLVSEDIQPLQTTQ